MLNLLLDKCNIFEGHIILVVKKAQDIGKDNSYYCLPKRRNYHLKLFTLSKQEDTSYTTEGKQAVVKLVQAQLKFVDIADILQNVSLLVNLT